MNTAENKTSPGFAPRFLLAVAIFLLFTAGVKLCSVLLETKVLGASDPLLPLFTERQVIFAAAVLELGVAYALLRHRHAIWAPWLVLWLVGVFAAYRLGLWAVGFHGHCSCLGHLFDWLPGFDAWADRLMLTSLVVMAGGSLWQLRGVVGAATARNNVLQSWRGGLLICLFGWLAGTGGMPGFALMLVLSSSFLAQVSAGQLTAQGVLVGYWASRPTETLKPDATFYFTYSASNSVWRLVTIANNLRTAEGKVQYGYGIVGSDGEDTYTLSFVSDRLDFLLANEATFSASAAANSGQGTVIAGALPSYDFHRLICVALGFAVMPAPPDLKGLAVESAESLGGAPTMVQPQLSNTPDMLPAKVRFLATGYYLKDGKRVPMPAPFDQGYQEGEFTVLQYMRVGALDIPTVFEYRRYIPRLPGGKDNTDTWLAKRIVVSVTNCVPLATVTGPVEPFAGTPVNDFRFREPNYAHLHRFDYNLKDGRWLKKDDPRLRRLWDAKIEQARLQFGPATANPGAAARLAFVVILAAVVLGPLPIVAVRFLRARK